MVTLPIAMLELAACVVQKQAIEATPEVYGTGTAPLPRLTSGVLTSQPGTVPVRSAPIQVSPVRSPVLPTGSTGTPTGSVTVAASGRNKLYFPDVLGPNPTSAPARINAQINTPVPTALPTEPPTPTPVPTIVPTPLPTVAVDDAVRFGYKLGVNCVDDYDVRSGANYAASLGAPVVVVYISKSAAVELKQRYPNTIVVYRPFLNDVGNNVGELIKRYELAPSDPPLLYLGHNENEIGIDLSPDGVRARAAFDAQAAQLLKDRQPNAIYLAGSFAHGTPDFTNPDVCRAIREAYAPAYNSGLLWLDMHNYTLGRRFPTHPPSGAGIVDAIWYERRWQWLFTNCGFSPTVRHIVASETGVEAGSGGFVWAGYTEAQLTDWLIDHRRTQLTPLVVNGRTYPSPFRFGALFQFGVNGRWKNYDMRGYEAALVAECVGNWST